VLGSGPAGVRTPTKSPHSQSASQFAGSADTVIAKRLFGQPIQFAAQGVAFDLFIKTGAIKCLEPSAKTRKVVRSQTLDSFLNFLYSAHKY
jgi:hypothetical protein